MLFVFVKFFFQSLLQGEDKAKKIPKKKYNWPANVK